MNFCPIPDVYLYNIKNFKTLRTKKKRKEVKQQQYLDKSYFSFFGNFSIINLLQTYLLNTIRIFFPRTATCLGVKCKTIKKIQIGF